MLSGALEVPADKAAAYREAFPAMLRLLKALYDAGVTIIPGTDALAGYTLHHELELYVRAGIAPAEVLRMATWTPALVMGVNKDRGVIAAGKLADMILVDGDPTKNIRDLRQNHDRDQGRKSLRPGGDRESTGHHAASGWTIDARHRGELEVVSSSSMKTVQCFRLSLTPDWLIWRKHSSDARLF